MKRRRQRQIAHPSQNLDSFLDILTNTVGVLMFIGLFVALISVEAGTVVRTPLVSRSDKRPQYFEVRNNQIFYIDQDTVEQQIANVETSLPTCSRPDIPESINGYLYQYYSEEIEAYNACIAGKVEQLKNFRAETPYYTARLVNLDSLLYEPIESVEGESIKTLSEDNSAFNTVLETLNPSTDYLAFVVRPDSFEAFRQARKQAWQEGFDVGWEPFKPETPIIFGSGGRSIGVQ